MKREDLFTKIITQVSQGNQEEYEALALEIEQRDEMQLCEAYQSGDISDSEYHELMTDIVRADRLDEEADDLDVKSALVSAVMTAAKVV